MKVVRFTVVGSSGSSKNREAASSVEKTDSPRSWWMMSSIVGITYRSRSTATFRFLTSTQILTSPDDLTTGTIGRVQGVNSVISSIASPSFILSNSFCTFSSPGIGTHRVVLTLYGVAPSLSLILTG